MGSRIHVCPWVLACYHNHSMGVGEIANSEIAGHMAIANSAPLPCHAYANSAGGRPHESVVRRFACHSIRTLYSPRFDKDMLPIASDMSAPNGSHLVPCGWSLARRATPHDVPFRWHIPQSLQLLCKLLGVFRSQPSTSRCRQHSLGSQCSAQAHSCTRGSRQLGRWHCNLCTPLARSSSRECRTLAPRSLS